MTWRTSHLSRQREIEFSSGSARLQVKTRMLSHSRKLISGKVSACNSVKKKERNNFFAYRSQFFLCAPHTGCQCTSSLNEKAERWIIESRRCSRQPRFRFIIRQVFHSFASAGWANNFCPLSPPLFEWKARSCNLPRANYFMHTLRQQEEQKHSQVQQVIVWMKPLTSFSE